MNFNFYQYSLTIGRYKTNRINSCAKETGLSISTSKTQVKSINTKATIHVNIYGEPLEFVDDLTYFDTFIKKTV